VAEKPPSAGAVTGDQGGWETATRSPRAPGPSERDAFGALCTADGALVETAERFALAVRAGRIPDAGELELWLRMQGSPYVWPRAWASEGLDGAPGASIESWLEGLVAVGERRCGLARDERGPTTVVALVAADVLADLETLPLRARVGSWLTLEARLLVPAASAKVILLGPTGPPQPIPTAFAGQRIRAPFVLREPGRFLVQVLAEVSGGPRPVLEALVFADVEPPANPAPDPAPGEESGGESGDPAGAVFAMLSEVRAREGLPALQRRPELDRVALDHAGAMRDAGHIGHDLGSGDPAQRLMAAGIPAIRAGENVAHAASAKLVHRKLYASPSHRANLLSDDFDSVGVGAVTDAQGLLWVCQIYAR
jgi:uncharacterized protein YkwD